MKFSHCDTHLMKAVEQDVQLIVVACFVSGGISRPERREPGWSLDDVLATRLISIRAYEALVRLTNQA
jgi:hypothetical protein